jgi:hypothetical protein
MKIEVTKSLLASGLRDLVLFKLSRVVEFTNDLRAYWECYQNGREQGFTIKVVGDNFYRMVTISEQRNSDEIAVYPDNTAMQGLDETSYKTARYFLANDFSGVVEICVKYLTGAICSLV